MINTVIHGDCLEKLKGLETNSVDSIVTDPPYELGFMGKSWDSTGIANNVELWKECLRVLKPGGHLLSFSGTRTYHRMASAIEDAGFEVRDMIEWVYGSGFPKSLNIGKKVDELQGNEREVVGESKARVINGGAGKTAAEPGSIIEYTQLKATKGTSEWEGWGTALKPAHEPICMARKPLAEKTVAENVLKYGTGGINIDESRVGTETLPEQKAGQAQIGTFERHNMVTPERIGRFPANLIHDNSEEVRECFPDTNKTATGNVKVSASGKNRQGSWEASGGMLKSGSENIGIRDFGDSGNASRFFKSIVYVPKASKSERNKGCEELEEKEGIRTNAPRENEDIKTPTRTNNHPTVKPIALMTYLIKMVTPKGGVVLDPFAGSGSTLVATKQNGYQYIGIEMTDEYIDIINARLNI